MILFLFLFFGIFLSFLFIKLLIKLFFNLLLEFFFSQLLKLFLFLEKFCIKFNQSGPVVLIISFYLIHWFWSYRACFRRSSWANRLLLTWLLIFLLWSLRWGVASFLLSLSFMSILLRSHRLLAFLTLVIASIVLNGLGNLLFKRT